MPPVCLVLMKSRREFIQIGAAFLLAGEAPAAQDNLEEATIAQLQQALTLSRLTSVQLVEKYSERIAQIDKAGPRVNAVLEMNPDAPSIAAALDRERKEKGPRGPLHGIPILIKDNIDTGDKMMTSAGSLALMSS